MIGVTACGGSPSSNSTATSSGNTANALVCQHYRAQYRWKMHVTFPTAADAVKWEGYVAADEAEAQPGTRLAHDLQQELAAMQGKRNSYRNGAVARDCGAV